MSVRSRPSTPSFSRAEPYTGSIVVSIRPNPHSVSYTSPMAWQVDQNTNTIANTMDASSYTFDNVFPVDTAITNREVYLRCCSPIVHKFLHEGYNGTVFAYGMTGSGKTFSMRGDDSDPGFVKLSIDELFHHVESDSAKRYTLSLSYIEIYNEKIIDLLSETASVSQDLKVRDDPVHGIRVVGMNSPTISTKEQMLDLIRKGDDKRKTSATDFNARSSRSHSILQVRMNALDPVSKLEQNATLSLCDLAGSERATSSLERRKEGAYINKSLLALSTVINKLSLSSSASSLPGAAEHIPYRDSKLTRLLQPALSGLSLISILCTVHLGSASNNQQFVSETYNTLRFAARAKDIVMHVDINRKTSVVDSDAAKVIELLRATVEQQRQEIHMLKLHSDGPATSLVEKDMQISLLQAEIRVLHEKLEHLTRLTDLQKTETVLLRNDALNDLLGMGVDNNPLMMMHNLEEFYKRINYEMDEHKKYIAHLESQLKLAHQQSIASTSGSLSRQPSVSKLSDRHMEQVLRDQEEEIWHLKELIKDKDHVINGITKTSKLRRLVDSTSVNFQKPSSGTVTPPPSARIDKENLRDFRISPKKDQFVL